VLLLPLEHSHLLETGTRSPSSSAQSHEHIRLLSTVPQGGKDRDHPGATPVGAEPGLCLPPRLHRGPLLQEAPRSGVTLLRLIPFARAAGSVRFT